MSYRIAVTSDDGKYVNQHFGQTTHFLLFEVEDDGKYEYLGSVKNNPTCSSDEENKSEQTISLIDDVSILITQNLGKKPLEICIKKGIKPVISYKAIDDALDEVINNYTLE